MLIFDLIERALGFLRLSLFPWGGGDSGVDIGDNIANSLMLDSTASQYLSRTYTTSATATYFLGFKRGKMGVITPLVDSSIKFNANDTLTAFGLTTTAVFRDPGAHYLIHVSNNGLYTNTGAPGAPWIYQGAVTTSAITNPRIGFDGTNYADGYFSVAHIVDGSSVAYTSFGRVSADTGQGVFKTYTGAFGAAGSLLAFTNSAALGTDSSGNGNNWTLNGGITSANQYTDTPTNNYCVLNPLTRYVGSNTATLTKGNTVVDTGVAGGGNTFSTFALPKTGKWYFEVSGLISSSTGLSNIGIGDIDITSGVIYKNSGQKSIDYGSPTAYGASYTDGNNIGVAVGIDSNTVTFYKDNISQGAISFTVPITKALYAYFADSSGASGVAGTFNFGQKPFIYTPPAGFKALCTANLPDAGTVTVSGTFTGNLNADGPFVFCNGYPTTLTINGNAVTFGTHADKVANGFKLRTASSSYNNSGSNTWTATIVSNQRNLFKYANAQGNP